MSDRETGYEELLALRDVERRLGLSRWTLRAWIHSGRLPADRLPSGHYRVSTPVVEAIAHGDAAVHGATPDG